MDISKELQIMKSNLLSWKSLVQMLVQLISHVQLIQKKHLGIKLPFLVMIIKNLKKYFTFEVQV